MSFKSVTTTSSYSHPHIIRRILDEDTEYRKDFDDECLYYLDWFCDNCTDLRDEIGNYSYSIYNDSDGDISFNIYQCRYFNDHRTFTVTGFIKQYLDQLPQVKSARNV